MINQYTPTRGDLPAEPLATTVALEASTTEARAADAIASAWHLIEDYAGRSYYDVESAVATAIVEQDVVLRWPRYPYPAEILIESYRDGAWQEEAAPAYIPEMGEVIDLAPGRWRFTQVGTVTPEATVRARMSVYSLALYMLMYSPERREFRSVTAGDTTVHREAYMGLLRGSGAIQFIAPEVRW